MQDIDKTKKNIKMDELDDAKKKELFEKFIDGGGKVLSERQKKRNLSIDRKKQAVYQQKLNDHYEKQQKNTDKRYSPSPNVEIVQKRNKVFPERNNAFMSSFRLKIYLRFQGITGFNTTYFKKSFLKKINNQYKPALAELQLIYYFYFKKNNKVANRIIARLDKITPLYFEVIEKVGEIFDPTLMDKINKNYESFHDNPQPLSEIIDHLNELFRKIYILKSYDNVIYNAMKKTMDIYEKVNDGNSLAKYKKRDVKNALYIVFHKLYPKLHTLFSYHYGDFFSESDSRIDDILSIDISEKPGNRSKRKPQTPKNESTVDEKTDQNHNEINEESTVQKKSDISDIVKSGLDIMYKLNIKALRAQYDKSGLYKIVEETDKILISYLLFLEFTNEYSFILTTNKIKYQINFTNNIKVDYRYKMQELFNELRKCEKAFAAYAESYENYNNIKIQRPISNDQYLPYSKRVDEMIKKKNEVGAMTRMVLNSFMQRVSEELAVLVEDCKDQQNYIINCQDTMKFNTEIEGNKKLNNVKIYDALTIVLSYTSAFVYRLGREGDLSGNIDVTINDKSHNKNETSQSKSILDELDDIEEIDSLF